MRDYANEARQGDISLIKVSNLPEGAVDLNTTILQESETTGHNHHFKPNAPVKVYQTKEVPSVDDTITPDMGKFVVVSDTTILYHGKGFEPQPQLKGTGDHLAFKVEPGIYQIRIKREMNHTKGMMQSVVD